MHALLDRIAVLGHWAYVAEGLLVFAEDALFFGFVLPGESVVAVCGFLAHRHVLALWVVVAVAMAPAIPGDAVGFAIGRRYGDRMRRSWLGRRVGQRRWRAAEEFAGERGGVAVFLGRWTAFLRALVPTSSGIVGMRPATFSMWNAAGGVAWSITWATVGYVAGAAWEAIARIAGDLLAAAVVVAVVSLVMYERWRRRRSAESPPS